MIDPGMAGMAGMPGMKPWYESAIPGGWDGWYERGGFPPLRGKPPGIPASHPMDRHKRQTLRKDHTRVKGVHGCL
jgi:hypothetical protein